MSDETVKQSMQRIASRRAGRSRLRYDKQQRKIVKEDPYSLATPTPPGPPMSAPPDPAAVEMITVRCNDPIYPLVVFFNQARREAMRQERQDALDDVLRCIAGKQKVDLIRRWQQRIKQLEPK